jgi:hypothetical protein
VISLLSPEEREEFECDIKMINWDKLIKDYVAGILIWYLKEDKIAPEHNLT